jgi:hypothetical protein
MKHLRSFNESLTEDEVDELRDFCEIGLVYLLDENFIVDINSFRGSTGNVSFSFRKESGFTWSEVKDHMIPFLKRLSNKYVIVGRIKISFVSDITQHDSGFSVGPGQSLSVESLINDDNDFGDTLIRSIFIRIVDKRDD